jgi:hypothetical protein
MSRVSELWMLAPCARTAFMGLAASLARNTSFLPFETYRDPEWQAVVFDRGDSKADSFESAHQFGLAVDFVPFIDGNWRWDVPETTWDVLDAEAAVFGLLRPIAWDRAHIEHPNWKGVRRLTK